MKKKDLLIILIPTLIFVIAWIGFSIYDSAVTSTISAQEVSQIIPIAPTFNTSVISELKKRERVEPIYGTSTVITLSPIPSPKITNTPKAEATSGGTLKP